MDLAVLGKKAILIPAEGQTEQEYLAKTLSEKGFAIECKQESLDIENALERLKTIDGFSLVRETGNKDLDQLEIVLEKYL
jgi:UDP-N-acetylglucosamine:LPS N-acetylglucosamine transferase